MGSGGGGFVVDLSMLAMVAVVFIALGASGVWLLMRARRRKR